MNPKTRLGGLAAVSGLVGTTGLLLWLFELQGIAGLFAWGYHRPVFIGLGLAGFLPLLLRALGSAGGGAGKARAALRGLGAALGAALATLGLAGCVGLAAAASGSAGPPPDLVLLEPAAGIPLEAGRATAGGPLRLSISSDPHWGKEASDAAARSALIKTVGAARPSRDAFFLLGDIAEFGMFESSFRKAAAELASGLDGVPLRALMGNHDGLVNGEGNWKRHFFPKGMESDSGSPYFHSIEAGPATIVVLHLPWGTEYFKGEQERWLEERLASIPAGRPVIVLSHSFFYSSGYVDGTTGRKWYDHEENLRLVEPILRRHGVSLVVSGHNHYMELLEAEGISYAVVGAMGGRPDPEPSYRSPASLWFRQGGYGRLDLEVWADRIELRFLDEEGRLLKEHLVPVRTATRS